MKVMIVTKDVTGFNIFHPVHQMLQEKGCELMVVAEGLSMDLWMKSGVGIFNGFPTEGSHDQYTKVRFDIDPHKAISQEKPDVILTELADPNHLGNSFGLQANAFGVRLGFVEDIWYAHHRSEAKPDFVCTLDEFGRKTILEDKDHEPRIFITGSPSMDIIQFTPVDRRMREIIENIDVKRVVLIGGQGGPTTDLLLGLGNVLEGERNWLIIPCLHPKWVDNSSKTRLVEEWKDIIYGYEKNHRVLWKPQGLDPRYILPLVTDVVSIFSNILFEAIALGATPVSWMSEAGKKEMSTSLKMNISSFPLVELGAAIEVSTSQEYREKVVSMTRQEREKFVMNAKKLMNLDFRATERVVEAVLTK